MLDESNFFLLPFPICTVLKIMGPYFGWAPGGRTSCPRPEPALSAQKYNLSILLVKQNSTNSINLRDSLELS
jgi:hypothetical protein